MPAARNRLAPLALAAALAAFAAPAAAGEPFADADANGDGVLDKAEFHAFIDALAAAGRPAAEKVKAAGRYDMAFRRVDGDGDGAISAAEVAAMK